MPSRKVSQLPPPFGVPDPVRPLGQEGRRTWERVWELRKRWIDAAADVEHVQLLCEAIDERMALRLTVLRSGDWRERVALRALDGQIAGLLGALGLNPSERERLTQGEEPRGRLAELRAARAKQATARE